MTRNLALDGELKPRQVWLPVIIVSGEQERYAESAATGRSDDGERVQDYLTWDDENPSSIVSALGRRARDNARSIREVVSLETWEAVNDLHLWMGGPRARVEWREDRHGFYRRIRTSMQSLPGHRARHHAPRRRLALHPARRPCWSGPARPPASSTCTTTPSRRWDPTR